MAQFGAWWLDDVFRRSDAKKTLLLHSLKLTDSSQLQGNHHKRKLVLKLPIFAGDLLVSGMVLPCTVRIFQDIPGTFRNIPSISEGISLMCGSF